MSPLFREPLLVGLGPQKVSLARLGRNWHGPRLKETREMPCAKRPSAASDWAASLEALQNGLDGIDGRGGDVSIVLSNHFARYVLVPRNGELSGEEEELGFARHCFAEVYGHAADSWTIRLSADGGESQVACGVDAALLEALESTVEGAGRHLRSVQPYLMVAFNRWRRALAGPLVWFVLAEEGQLCLAALRKGRWVELATRHAGTGWSRELPAMLARQRLLAGLDEEKGVVFVSAADEFAASLLEASGETVHRLRLPSSKGIPPGQADPLHMMLYG